MKRHYGELKKLNVRSLKIQNLFDTPYGSIHS